MGFYRCFCKEGYTGDGFICIGRFRLEIILEMLGREEVVLYFLDY